MPRPIPVFEFVLNAYAATCAGGGFRPAATPAAERVTAALREIALDAGLLASAAGLPAVLEGLMVKLCVGDGEPAAGPKALLPGDASGGGSQELWLYEIVETPSGLLGVVRFPPERLTNVRAGDAIAFRRPHVLDWRRCEAGPGRPTPQAADAPAPLKPARPAAEAALP